MRTPIIVKSGSIELLTNRLLDESPSGPPFVYRLKGWQGSAAVDAFDVSNGRVSVRDDSGQGDRRLEIWLTGTPTEAVPFKVEISRSSSPGFRVTTDRRLARQSRSGGRPFVYIYGAEAARYSYNLYAGGTQIEGRDLDQAAFVLSIRHVLELDFTEPVLKYLALGAGAGLVGALVARQLAHRTRGGDRDE
jgi:hypothetical protein